MQSTALPVLLDGLTVAARRALLEEQNIATLPAAFAAVPDPRSRHGRRYEPPFLLSCLVGALLCACDSLEAVGQWCREHRALLVRHFPHHRFHTPTGSLYRRLLPRLSVAHLECAVAAWGRASRPLRDREPVALDGKTVRGAGTATQPAPHLLSVSTHQTQETLVQVRVADHTNEIPVAQALVPLLPLRGRVVTPAALHTQTALAQMILDHGGDYLCCVKENQPTLHADLAFYFAAAFAAAHATDTEVTTMDRRRGRTETRTLRVTAARTATLLTGFPRLAQVAQLIRTVRDREGAPVAVTYFITSCRPRRTTAAQLLALIRGHWSIEARHWVRDGTFGEDRSRLRCGHAPQVMATLRSLVITLIRRTKTTAIAAQRRFFAYHPAQALALLLSKTHSAR
jgi:predicted transposase YbfD/YdcC